MLTEVMMTMTPLMANHIPHGAPNQSEHIQGLINSIGVMCSKIRHLLHQLTFKVLPPQSPYKKPLPGFFIKIQLMPLSTPPSMMMTAARTQPVDSHPPM